MLVITSDDPILVAIRSGVITMRNDLQSAHKEADVIIVNELVELAVRVALNICIFL